MRTLTGRQMINEFFKKELNIAISDDFRGIAFYPDILAAPGSVVRKADAAVVVGYNGFIGKTCCMHVVVQHPQYVTREMTIEAFSYPFEDLKMETIFALVDSVNEKAIRYDQHLGFKEFQTIPGGALEGDLVMMKMNKADCRWLRSKHAEKRSAAVA